MSPEFVDVWSTRLGVGAVWLGVFTALVALLAWYFADKNAKNKDAELKHFQVESAQSIENAKKDAEVAKEGAAKANERANELEKETANTKLKYEQLKQSLAWREMSPEQEKTLIAQLATRPASVAILWMESDPEALTYAHAFSKVFESAGWQTMAFGYSFNGLAQGIVLNGRNPEAVAILSHALDSAKIVKITDQLPPGKLTSGQGMMTGGPGMLNVDCVLLIGVKPKW